MAILCVACKHTVPYGMDGLSWTRDEIEMHPLMGAGSLLRNLFDFNDLSTKSFFSVFLVGMAPGFLKDSSASLRDDFDIPSLVFPRII